MRSGELVANAQGLTDRISTQQKSLERNVGPLSGQQAFALHAKPIQSITPRLDLRPD